MNQIRQTVTADQLAKIRTWADRNAAQWVLDMIYDETVNTRGPMQGLRVCDCFGVRFIGSLV